MADLPSGVRLLRAPNPGPMTLQGTNSWLLDSARGAVLVDPGPDDPDHLAALLGSGPVAEVWITHHHLDHTGLVDALHERTGVVVRAADPGWCRGGDRLQEGERIAVDAGDLVVLGTPGHTADSLSFVLEGSTPAVLTGDTVLGTGTSVVAAPDGDLADHLASLRRLASIVGALAPALLLPGHGPVVTDPTRLGDLLAHRLDRIEQTRAAVVALGTDPAGVDPADVVARVYPDLLADLVPAATATVRATLAFLAEEGRR